MVYRITMLYNTIQYNTIQYNVVLAWCERTLCVLCDDLRGLCPWSEPLHSIVSICSIQLFNSIQFAIASNLRDKQWYTPYMCM